MIWLVCTALADEDAFRFAVVGDTQTDGYETSINSTVFPAIIEAANQQNAEYLLVAGDLVGGSGTVGGTVTQWEDFSAATADFDGTLLVTVGNHDVYGAGGTFAAFRDHFGMPTDSPEGEEGVSYVFDHGDTRFVAVSSDQEDGGYRISSAALAWLDEVLADSGDFEHVYVMTHHPVTFSTDNSLGGTYGDFWQLLVANGVEALFTGHWHRIQASQPGNGGPTWETILGTGGGWTGFSPIRDYQQQHGFVLVEVDGAWAQATFYGDGDGDGEYDEALDTWLLDPGGEAERGLRARYRFDEGVVADSAPRPLGKGIGGEVLGDARINEGGPFHGYLALDGDGDSVEAGAIGDYVLAIKGELTLSMWVRIDSAQPGRWGNALLCYATNDYAGEDEQSNYSWWLSVADEDGSLLAFWEHGDGENVYASSSEGSDLIDGDWHHVAFVRSETDARFFVDGREVGETQAVETLPTGGGRGMLYMGSDTRANLGNESDLHGALDEICVYDLALADYQVVALADHTECDELPEDPGPVDTGPHDSDPTDTGETESPEGRDPVIEAERRCGCAGGPVAPLGLGLVLLLASRRTRSRAPGSR
ncbi:MAG TPA: LamG-like jellyroll fold domain-containing protein [Myxococcota bacterium]|nr:LamG-like jellyroll fold domain-containing protein [Myxococcota bacterium]